MTMARAVALNETYAPVERTPVNSPIASSNWVENPEIVRQGILNRLTWGRMFWRPLHDRMDYWLSLYKLLDPIQQLKPVGIKRWVSNDPMTAVNTGVNILTRNEPFWRIDLPYGMDQRERASVGAIERCLAGIVDDFDSMFIERYDGTTGFWPGAAWYALLRGCIWGKFQVTRQALDWGRPSPFLGEFWDGRWTYPNTDGIGLESVITEKRTTLNELVFQYGDVIMEHIRSGGTNLAHLDPNSEAVKIEYWSNDRPDMRGSVRKGIYALLGCWTTVAGASIMDGEALAQGSTFLVPPVYHGYKPDELPVIGVPVNGLPFRDQPLYGTQVLGAITGRAMRLGLKPPTWHDASGWVADWCRGLLSTVEEVIPQSNELLATMIQHTSEETWGTWVSKTQTGELPQFQGGVGSRVPLRIGESLERLAPQPLTRDSYQMLAFAREEKAKGMLDEILQSSGTSVSSGVELQQKLSGALNNLQPFSLGLTNFGSQFASHMLKQLRRVDTGVLSLVAKGTNRSYVRIEFDPKQDLGERKYKPIPIFRPSVPEDILYKAQVAKLLLDPRMPVMSVVTVLDKIFQLDDPEGEIDRMLEDVANRDPVILLERVADILAEDGMPELADRIRQKEFQAQWVEKAKMLEVEAQVQMLMQQLQAAQGQPAPTSAPGMAPSAPSGGGLGPASTATSGLASTSGAPESTGAMPSIPTGQGM